MSISSEPLKSKGAELRNVLLDKPGGWRGDDFLLSELVSVKVKWHSSKNDENVWTDFRVARVSTNCFMAHPFDLPFWSVMEYKLMEGK